MCLLAEGRTRKYRQRSCESKLAGKSAGSAPNSTEKEEDSMLCDLIGLVLQRVQFRGFRGVRESLRGFGGVEEGAQPSERPP